MTAFIAAIAADAVTFLFFGTTPCLFADQVGTASRVYPWLIVLG
ncbi:MAG: hypothetical protein ACLSH6_02795 [Limosilactobacillus pontis]